jgi:hypothetical protein
MNITITDELLNKEKTYKVSNLTCNIYILSCFLFWITGLALLCNGCFRYRYGTLTLFFILFQPFFSFMNDYYNIYNHLNIWCCIDRIWSTVTLLISFLFIYKNDFYNNGRRYYIILLIIGLIFWVYSIYLFNSEVCNDKWCWMVILWHIFPVLGSTITIYHLKPQIIRH